MKRSGLTAAALGAAFGAAIFVAAGSASAADLGARAPVYKAPVPLAYNWTGFYVGGNAGLGVGAGDSALTIPAFPNNERFTRGGAGGIAGLQGGYNWQFGNWVVGAEADIQWSGVRGGDTCVLGCFGGTATTIGTALDWFGTVRARVGYATGPVLAYYTGGFAYGDTRTTIAQGIAAPATSVTLDQTRTGWTLGSGVEAALDGNWTGKIEYLYVDLGSSANALTIAGVATTYSADYRYHVFRAGLNYRFGDSRAMLAATPASDWRGFYAGGNFGSGVGQNASALNLATATAERTTLAPEGFLGGVQIGYNWQNANIVYGVEADIQGTTFKDDRTCLLFCNTPAASANIKQTLPWFGTLRGRLGYAAGPALFYVTGGLAYGNAKTTISEVLPAATGSVVIDGVRAGWAVGAGMERPTTIFGLVGPGWTVKSEYLYVDLGTRTGSFTLGGFAQTFSAETREHIFRSGLSYHFNQPIMARY